MSQDVTLSWFVVLNNPSGHGYTGTPQEVCERLRDEWIQDSTTRTGAWAYCISAAGLHHVHMVLEDAVAMRFSAIKKSYAIGAHLEPTKGSKKQAEDYIYKRHPYDEKGEEVVCVVKAGEIRGKKGKRSDLDRIQEMLEDGKTPGEILAEQFSFYRYEKQIRSAYFQRRLRDTPPAREVRVHLIVGESGSGKSYLYTQLCNKYGDDNVCIVTDYQTGGLDHYEGQPILFLDEYKGQYQYSTFLTILDKYRVQIHARYCNIWALWSEVYITSVYPPERLYQIMVPMERWDYDSRQQMYRRITDITYTYMMGKEYRSYTIPMSDYTTYQDLEAAAIFASTSPLSLL